MMLPLMKVKRRTVKYAFQRDKLPSFFDRSSLIRY